MLKFFGAKMWVSRAKDLPRRETQILAPKLGSKFEHLKIRSRLHCSSSSRLLSTQIIHCDVKPQNILLDDFFMAKISDFGLAKLLNTNQTRTETGIRGTRGYVAPEWWFKNKNKNVAITAKVHVYSFGIMLLEIICCRKNAKAEVGAEEIDILSEWLYEHFMERDFHLLVANDEEAKNDGNRIERFLMVALWCIQEDPSLRPTMKKVTQMLEGAVEVSMPPEPSSFLS